jgi:hypothetical protein
VTRRCDAPKGALSGGGALRVRGQTDIVELCKAGPARQSRRGDGPEEYAEFSRELELSAKEADAGELIDAADVLAKLRATA